MTDEEKIIRACTPPTNDDELWEYLVNVWNIKLPRKAACPGCSAPFDVIADCFFARHPVVVLRASRGVGKSVLLGALSLTEQVALNLRVFLLAASEDQSKRILQMLRVESPEYMGYFWDAEGAPTEMYDPTNQNQTTSGIIRHTPAVIKALSSSPKAVRGHHPARLRVDEIDECDLDIIKSSIGMMQPAYLMDGKKKVYRKNEKGDMQPVILQDFNVLLASTHHRPDGPMTYYWDNAHKLGYKRHSYCWRDCLVDNGGWILPETMDQLKIAMGPQKFRVEFDLGSPSVDSCIWDPELINELFTGEYHKDLPGYKSIYQGDNGEEISFPPQGGRHYSGADWAKEHDYTALTAFERGVDGKPDRLLYFKLMNRMDWSYMVDQFNKVGMVYYGPSAHDETGCGSVVDELLKISSIGINFSKRTLIHDILTSYQKAIQDKKIVFPNIEWLKKAHIMASHDQFYGSAHLNDGIVSCALAWYARSTGMDDILIGR